MKQKNFIFITATLFTIIFLMHLIRIIYGWDAMIGGVAIPLWASWLALVLSGLLAYLGFKINK